MKRILILMLTTLCLCVVCQAQTSGSFSSYYEGKFYESVVTPEMLERSPAWMESAESPPLSARRALELAEEALPKVVSKDKKWGTNKISLYPVWEKWVYVVEFRQLTLKANYMYDGPMELFSVVVLMNGEVVKPMVKQRKSP